MTTPDRDVLLEVECHALPVSLCRQVCAVDCGAEEWPCGPIAHAGRAAAGRRILDDGELL